MDDTTRHVTDQVRQLNESEAFLLRLIEGSKNAEYTSHLRVALAAVRAVRWAGEEVIRYKPRGGRW